MCYLSRIFYFQPTLPELISYSPLQSWFLCTMISVSVYPFNLRFLKMSMNAFSPNNANRLMFLLMFS